MRDAQQSLLDIVPPDGRRSPSARAPASLTARRSFTNSAHRNRPSKRRGDAQSHFMPDYRETNQIGPSIDLASAV
jgi:hypothetical protein